LFRSNDRGESFRPLADDDGLPHATRGMVMRLREDPSGKLVGTLSDGCLIRVSDGHMATIAEKLPPAFDFVTLPSN
jgi:hypothetical protein